MVLVRIVRAVSTCWATLLQKGVHTSPLATQILPCLIKLFYHHQAYTPTQITKHHYGTSAMKKQTMSVAKKARLGVPPTPTIQSTQIYINPHTPINKLEPHCAAGGASSCSCSTMHSQSEMEPQLLRRNELANDLGVVVNLGADSFD